MGLPLRGFCRQTRKCRRGVLAARKEVLTQAGGKRPQGQARFRFI